MTHCIARMTLVGCVVALGLCLVPWELAVASFQQPDADSPVNADLQPPDEPDDGDGWDFEDDWGFEDDEFEVETWGQLFGEQFVDIAMFGAFAVLAMVSFVRKSVPLKMVTFVAAIAYMGFYKSQLISITNIFGLLDGNLPIFRYSLAWYSFAIFTVGTTVLWGRLYCGRICAYGALTQLLDRVVPSRLRVEVPAAIERRAALIKYGLLGGTVIYFLATADISIYRWVEPFWMFTLRGTTGMWVALGLLLLATIFVRNLYCRFLCPVGAALGLLSKLTIFGIKRWSECNSCRICEKTCEWGAIRGPEIVMTECVRCDDCERLYMEKNRCPHWLILRKKSEVEAAAGRPA